MKLKLVVASMSMLGLISCPVFAAETTHKHKTHHRVHVRHHVTTHQDYKAMGSLPVQPAPMETSGLLSATSTTSTILDQMSQNIGMNKPMPEWFNRIGVSGGITLDAGKWGSRSVVNSAAIDRLAKSNTAAPYNYGANGPKVGYLGENTKRLSLNNAYLNVTADINEWTKALAVLGYTDVAAFYDQSFTSPLTVNPVNFGTLNQKVNLEQAYVHFGNPDCSHFFVKIGKQYQDYGRYALHPITLPMTQVLTETLRNSIQLGFVTDMGLHGSAFTFQDGLYKTSDSVNKKENSVNYGANVGYSHPDDQLGYDFGVGYMRNMLGANNVASMLADTATYNGYANRVGALAAYADLNFDAFTLAARYTKATQHFNASDLPQSLNHLTTGARPWAAGIQAGYGFNTLWSKTQELYVGYQASHDTVYLNLPRSRYVVGYSIDALKNVKLSAEWNHDNAWKASDGGPMGGDSNLVSVRAAVKFG